MKLKATNSVPITVWKTDFKYCAALTSLRNRYSAAMGLCQFCRYCQPKARAALACRGLERLKHFALQSRWNARASIRNGDQHQVAFALCTDAHFIFGLWSTFDGLNGIAHQIGKNTRKLFMISIY